MIDLHCHILPGIDDGPPTMADSVALARAAVAAGIHTTVATPHVTWDHQHNTAERIAEAVVDLRAVLAVEQVPLEVLAGAEIGMTRVGDLDQAELEGLRLGSSPYLLVECPLSAVTAGFGPLLRSLRDAGHEVLLGHPERCPAFQRDPASYAALIDDGMLGQVTSGALVGRFGPPARELGLRLLRDGLAHDVSSDGHSAGRRRPSIGPELEEAGFGPQSGWLAHDAPRAILDGAALPPAPPMPEAPREGVLSRLRRRQAG